jgi:hypothetical protein
MRLQKDFAILYNGFPFPAARIQGHKLSSLLPASFGFPKILTEKKKKNDRP